MPDDYIGVAMALDSDAGEVVKVGSVAVPRTAGIGAKPSSSKPDADRRSTQLDPLDFAFGESRLRVKVRPMIPLSPGQQSSG